MADSVTFECSVRLRHFPRTRRRSTRTGNPSPPMMTAPMIGTSTNQSELKPIRLSAYSENPALLNAVTAWKAPLHAAVPMPTS